MANTKPTSHEIETAKAGKSDKMTDKARDAAASAQQTVREAAATAEEHVRDAAHSVAERTSHAVDRGAEHASALQHEFDTMVRRNPTAAILGAVGVGILVGMALRGRD
ncbi:hypothetical protein [Marivita sp. GX14005]|uniref:hypothetical protein n=1 Tax=Marivita sp. GX14005 TaxID=2942276 RepID=UPI00201863E5|nr:hypothetical protein [Marivita sp. GX14005]MCL3880737.1 hypothetical protein [Marivita sp. GX14005]